LKLWPTRSLFEHEFLELDNKIYPTSEHIFYNGKLVDEPNSKVSGSIIEGVFYGTIKTENGNYHIESSKRYKGEFKSHSIIYHEDDVLLNNKIKKRDTSHDDHIGCATENVMDWMKKYQKDAFKEHDDEISLIETNSNKQRSKNEDSFHKINKRVTTTTKQFPNGSNVCDFYLRVDPFFYKEVYNNEGSQVKSNLNSCLTVDLYYFVFLL
jgi:hypothetical protein